jgi:hypothetical protein
MGLTRREFLMRVGQAGGYSAAFLSLQAMGITPLRAEKALPLVVAPGTGNGVKVVILGGGISGLVAAYEMKALGYDCTLLEARERPGGRNWSVRGGDKIVFTAVGGAAIARNQPACFGGPVSDSECKVDAGDCRCRAVRAEMGASVGHDAAYDRALKEADRVGGTGLDAFLDHSVASEKLGRAAGSEVDRDPLPAIVTEFEQALIVFGADKTLRCPVLWIHKDDVLRVAARGVEGEEHDWPLKDLGQRMDDIALEEEQVARGELASVSSLAHPECATPREHVQVFVAAGMIVRRSGPVDAEHARAGRCFVR